MRLLTFCVATSLVAAGAGIAQAQALTRNRVNVSTRGYVPTADGTGLRHELSDAAFGDGAVALGKETGQLTGQRDVIQAYDGRCVVIATGAPCQGNEDPLTTQTILNPSKPVTAQEGTSASANASAHARAGRVGAMASSSVSTGLSHASIDPANPGRSISGRRYSTGSAYASAYAASEHTNTLLGPSGVQATITLTGTASSELFIDSTLGLGNSAAASLRVLGSAAPIGQRCNNFAWGCVAEFSFGRWADPGNGAPIVLGSEHRGFSISFQARAQDVVRLLTEAHANTSNSGLADASHTLSIDAIELSSGFSLADESAFVRNGNRYVFAAATVPEPASAALLLGGLLAVAGYARARRPTAGPVRPPGPRAC